LDYKVLGVCERCFETFDFSRFPVGIASRICLPNLFWGIFSQGKTSGVEISLFGEIALYSKLYEFHSCALCHELPHRELLAKFLFVSLVLEIALSVITKDL